MRKTSEVGKYYKSGGMFSVKIDVVVNHVSIL